MRTKTTSAILVAYAASAFAGQAHVVNNCNFDVWFSVSRGGSADNFQKLGKDYSEEFQSSTSIKLSKSKTPNGVAQFEYHAGSGDGKVWYDTSNIDGNPFKAEGTRLSPSKAPDATFNTCVTVECQPGEDVCAAAYNLPDDLATKNCAIDTDLTFTVCSGNSGSASSDIGTKSESSNNNPNPGGDSDKKAVIDNEAPTPATTAAAQPAATSTKVRWGSHRRRHEMGIDRHV